MTLADQLAELSAAEAQNTEATLKHLGHTGDLVIDFQNAYGAITPLIRAAARPAILADGSIDWNSSQTAPALSLSIILHELMMCKMLLAKSGQAVLRMYRGEAFTHLRRAIEACAFSVRMSKHPELCTKWSEAGSDKEGESIKYNEYRRAFETKDLFPKKSHVDYDPLLTGLREQFDICSKIIHGSVFGMSGHFGTVPASANVGNKQHVNFSDLPTDSFVATFFFVLTSHFVILQLFGRILEPHMTDVSEWTREHSYISAKLQRNNQKWLPNVMALNTARNSKTTTPKKSI